eukprot:13972320-Alexandrium_andersonii.AAC.1
MGQSRSLSTKTTAVWMTQSLGFQMAVDGSGRPRSRRSRVLRSQGRGFPDPRISPDPRGRPYPQSQKLCCLKLRWGMLEAQKENRLLMEMVVRQAAGRQRSREEDIARREREEQ